MRIYIYIYTYMKYRSVKTNHNPFSDYFETTNPSFHETIKKHYEQTTELVLNSETSVFDGVSKGKEQTGL